MQLPYQTEPPRPHHACLQDRGAVRRRPVYQWFIRRYWDALGFMFFFCFALLVLDGGIKAIKG